MKRRGLSAYVLAAGLLGGYPVCAAEGDDEPKADETVTVRGDSGDRIAIVPSEPVDAVFGLTKSLFETPRSVTSIAVETMDRFGMTDIDDLVMLSASSFTQSFFGVSGSLDLRGTSGENYFNGIRRLDNPGNYATPIGAADRVDIVRGPASVIYGPSKIGGYMNFVPKSARADTGQFLREATGEVSVTTGSWDRAIATAEVDGPGSLGGRRFGYYLFGEWEDSGSYYRDTATGNRILQATFNVDLSDRLRVLWGGMYQDYAGNEVGGWNRLTQELVDHGTYVTGLAKPLDADGDGFISHAEYDAANGGAGLFEFVVDPASRTGPSVFGGDFALDPGTIGTAQLDGDQVLVARDDVLRTEDLVFYADLHFTAGPRWQVTNELYFEGYDHLSEVAYGFAEFADSRVFEDQLIVTFSEATGWGRVRLLASPSIRRTDFEHANDFVNEHFDRRDLTGPSTARDRRLLATRIDRDYTDYSKGYYTTFGFAVLTDLDWDNGLNAVLGIRQERIDLESRQRGERRRSGESFDAEDTVDVLSYTASLSLRTSWEDWRVFASVADVASVYSGFSRRVKLPPYTLVNAGLQYDGRRWCASKIRNVP